MLSLEFFFSSVFLCCLFLPSCPLLLHARALPSLSLSLLYIRMVGIWKSVSNIAALSFNTVYCKVAALLQRNGSHPSSASNKQLILSWCGSIRTEETVCMGRNSGLSHLTTGTPDTLMNTHAFSDVCTKPNTPSTQIHTRPYSSKSN